jgi:hypothetical protein
MASNPESSVVDLLKVDWCELEVDDIEPGEESATLQAVVALPFDRLAQGDPDVLEL